MRQHRDKLASTGSTVFARSCQALPDLVIISKGIAPFCHTFIKCEVISSYWHQSKQLVWLCRFIPTEGHFVSEICKNKVMSSSPLCFKNCFCLNSLSGKGGMGIDLVAVTVCCSARDLQWTYLNGGCLQGKCLCLSLLVSARVLVGFGRLLCLSLREM